MVVPDKMKYEQLAGVVAESGKGFIEDIDLLDVYRGEQIGIGTEQPDGIDGVPFSGEDSHG